MGGGRRGGEKRPSCLESERRERRHREAGRERRGPVRVVGRRRRLAAGIAGVQGRDVVVVQVVRERRCIDRRAQVGLARCLTELRG